MNILKLPINIICFIFVLLTCSIFPIIGAIVGFIIFPIFGLINRRFYSNLMSKFAFLVWAYYVWLIERVSGASVRFTGQQIPYGESAIVIGNHTWYLDWVILFSLAIRKGRLGYCKFFAKDMIKYIPGFGWGIYFLDSVFLKRNWAADAENIQNTFAHLKRNQLPVWMISWPEGTRLDSVRKLQSSQKYSRENNLPILNHIIIPRTKGFVATVRGLQGCCTVIYDVTVGFGQHKKNKNSSQSKKDSIWLPPRPGLWELPTLNFNRIIHMHVRRYTLSSLPQTDSELSDWLIERFKEKDQLLEHFEKYDCFPGEEINQ
eukprot:TRINITY_DN7755_c0_g1_i1.p1 TRINITY_DN7755_c0_g1~~TRINITY_DN7755_c0_g1_i1.p1  ORF type:complete len:317 (+),score=101.59 TRINITY_DN7755_c0_g1_i1:43-993(+)